MSLPDEFLDAFPGRAPGSPAPVAAPCPRRRSSTSPLPSRSPRPPSRRCSPAWSRRRAAPRMGAEATDLPPLDRPDLPDLGAGSGFGEARELRLLQEVQVELAVELGRVKLPLRDLLALGPGAVLELDRAADAPVDVLVNGCLVAKGEVVVIDGEFGVRVTAVVER